jgi:hypothetical protein
MKRFFPSRILSAFGLLAIAALCMGANEVRQRYLRVDTLEVVTSLTNEGTITQTGALTQTGAASFDGNVTLGNAAADLVTVTGTVQGASPLVFEGATANAFEGTIAVADVTADRTWTLPDGPGTVMLSSLATNAVDAANAITGASNALVFEGATADGFELSVAPADPTADVTATFPVATGNVMIAFATGTDAVANGQTSKATTVTGGLSTDIALVILTEVASNSVSIRAAIMTADTLTVTLTGDPGASNCDYQYIIIRD